MYLCRARVLLLFGHRTRYLTSKAAVATEHCRPRRFQRLQAILSQAVLEDVCPVRKVTRRRIDAIEVWSLDACVICTHCLWMISVACACGGRDHQTLINGQHLAELVPCNAMFQAKPRERTECGIGDWWQRPLRMSNDCPSLQRLLAACGRLDPGPTCSLSPGRAKI